MTNTDSGPFMDIVPAISVRENERGVQIGNGWDPQWHQPTDVFATYTDKDFRLGLNAAQTTLGAVARTDGRNAGQVNRYRIACVAGAARSRSAIVRESLPQRLPLRRQPHDSEQRLHPHVAQHPAVLHQPGDVQRAAVEPELPAAGDDDAGARLLARRRAGHVRVSRHELHVVPGPVRAAGRALPAADGSRATRIRPTAGSRCWRRRGTRCTRPTPRRSTTSSRARRSSRRSASSCALVLFARGGVGEALSPVSDSRRAGDARQGNRRDVRAAAVASTSPSSNASCRCASCSAARSRRSCASPGRRSSCASASSAPGWRSRRHYSPGGTSRWHYLLTQPFVILHYALSLFLPLRLSADTQWPLVVNPLDARVLARRRVRRRGADGGVGDVAAPRDAADRVWHPVVLYRAAADLEHRAAVRADERSPDVLSVRRVDPRRRVGGMAGGASPAAAIREPQRPASASC